MNQDDDRDARLDRALAGLSLQVRPPHDLWPAIETRLAPAASWSWPPLLAAGLVLVALTALVTGVLVEDRRGASAVVATTLPGPSRNDAGANAKLLATRAELRRSFDERLSLLAPPTRAAVLHSLSTIRRAHDELEQALAQDPSSTLVRELFETTSHQEYSLYEDVVRSTDILAVRT